MHHLKQAIAKTLFNEQKEGFEKGIQKVVGLVVKETKSALSDESEPEVKWFNVVRDLIPGNFEEVFGEQMESAVFDKIFKKVVKELAKSYDFIDVDKADGTKEEGLYQEDSRMKGLMPQKQFKVWQKAFIEIGKDLEEDGYEIEDVIAYLHKEMKKTASRLFS